MVKQESYVGSSAASCFTNRKRHKKKAMIWLEAQAKLSITDKRLYISRQKEIIEPAMNVWYVGTPGEILTHRLLSLQISKRSYVAINSKHFSRALKFVHQFPPFFVQVKVCLNLARTSLHQYSALKCYEN